jgi:integrase
MVEMKRDGKSAQTIVHARSVLKNGLRAAVRWKLIDRDPTDGTERPRVDYEPTVLSGEQMAGYLRAFTGHVIEPVVILAIAGGFRRSELCGLDWSDIDFDAYTVTIKRGLHQRGSRVWFEELKSRTSWRTIEIPAAAVERLRALRAVGPLLPDSEGRMAPDKVSRLYDAQVTDSGLVRVPLRNLRNSYGTFLRTSGVDIETIADLMGHSDASITRKHYIARQNVVASEASMAAVQSIFVRQNAPTGSESIGKGTQEIVADARKAVGNAR